jgi:hypothetical protein
LNTNLNAQNVVLGIGIASGLAEDGDSMIGTVSIVNGTIGSHASKRAAGIGAGYASDGNSTIINLAIAESRITTKGGNLASGTGTGYATKGGHSLIENVTISDSNLMVMIESAFAGLGAGFSSQGSSSIQALDLQSCRIRSQRLIGSAIQGGFVISLVLNGESVINCVAPLTANSIVLNQASVVIMTNAAPSFGISPSIISSFDLAIVYESVAKSCIEPLDHVNGIFIHFGSIVLPVSSFWSFCFWNGIFRHCFLAQSLKIQRIIASLPEKYIFSNICDCDW